MKNLFLMLLLVLGFSVAAQEDLSQPEPGGDYSVMDMDRDPASISPLLNVPVKRSYPGGADEEDLRVQSALPEAALKTDARSVQREVYKTLYNQELKEERQDTVEE